MLKKLTTNLTIVTSSLTLFLFNPKIALAVVENPVTGKLGQSSPGETGSNFFNYFFMLWQGGLVVLGMYIMGAFEWITSGSDPKGAEKGRTRITNATIGLIILVSLFTIISFVNNLLFGKEFNILKINLPTADSVNQVNTKDPDTGLKSNSTNSLNSGDSNSDGRLNSVSK